MKACHDFVKKLEEKVTFFYQHLYSQKACWIVIGAGSILRISQYLFNRSLTEGEAALALNIVQRTYSELLKPLDYIQAAPLGFLIAQKFATTIFGTHEYALRIFPLIAGIISLFLFYEIAKKAINEKALPIALILFAVGDHLIYFSSEVKQYSSDVAITLLILLLTINIMKNNYTFRNIFLFGCVGAITFWFSHPALFTFCGGTVALFLAILRNKKRHIILWLCTAIVIAVISFVINYFVSLESLIGSKDFVSSWHGRFESFPQIPFDPKWLGYVFLRIFKFPVGLSTYELFLAVLSFLIGCVVLLCKRIKILLVLSLPILFTIIAAEFRKYPFEGRLLLFMTPFVVLIIAVGIHYLQRKADCGSPIVGFALVLLILIQPIFLAGYRLIVPRAPEELRTVMEYTQQHYREGDTIYLYYASVNAYRFYADRFNFTKDYIVGIDARSEWARYDQDLRQLMDKERVWIMFSHVATWYGVNEEKLFLSYLDRYGIRKDAYRASGASVYLYDMNN